MAYLASSRDHDLSDEIEFLTGNAEFLLPTFQYDAAEGRVTFIVERRPFKELKRRLLGVLEYALYDQTERVRTTVEIGHVANADFQRSESAPVDADRFYIERGIGVSNDRIWIDSVQEERGTKAFRLILRITAIDIRLEDLRP